MHVLFRNCLHIIKIQDHELTTCLFPVADLSFTHPVPLRQNYLILLLLLKATSPLLRRHPHQLYAAMPRAPLKRSRAAKKGRTGDQIARALLPSPSGTGRRGTSEPSLRPRSARIRNRAENARRSDVDERNDDSAVPPARSNHRARGTLRPTAQLDRTGSAQEQDGNYSNRSAGREIAGRRPIVRRDDSSNSPQSVGQESLVTAPENGSGEGAHGSGLNCSHAQQRVQPPLPRNSGRQEWLVGHREDGSKSLWRWDSRLGKFVAGTDEEYSKYLPDRGEAPEGDLRGRRTGLA